MSDDIRAMLEARKPPVVDGIEASAENLARAHTHLEAYRLGRSGVLRWAGREWGETDLQIWVLAVSKALEARGV